jgi:hypothetical protein
MFSRGISQFVSMSTRIETLLPTGRRVRLEQMHLLPTETDWSDVRQPLGMKEQMPMLVAKLFNPEMPYLLRNKELWPQPYTCLCLFSSAPIVPRDVSVEDSLLVVCWFTERVDVPVRQLACEGLSGVDWEAHARDFHSEW